MVKCALFGTCFDTFIDGIFSSRVCLSTTSSSTACPTDKATRDNGVSSEIPATIWRNVKKANVSDGMSCTFLMAIVRLLALPLSTSSFLLPTVLRMLQFYDQ